MPIYTVRNAAVGRDKRTRLGDRDPSQRGKRSCSWPSVADDRECVLDLNYAMLGDTGAVACAP